MKTPHAFLVRLALAAMLVFAAGSLGACGGGGGGGDAPVAAPDPQGLRFAIAPTYDRMVQSVDITGPEGTQKHTLRLSRGQEMFIPLPTGNYTLMFYIRVTDSFAMGDFTPRHAAVARERVTVVHYP